MGRTTGLVAAAAFIASAIVVGGALSAQVDSPTLVVNKQIGDVRMEETEAAVGYQYGSDCVKGCAGVEDGCVLGLTKCIGPIYRYRVGGGYMRVGYNHGHVVLLETNSPHYRTATGLGIGSAIPFGARFGVFHWHACGTSDGYWIGGSSWTKPLWTHGSSRWWTQLAMNKGRVIVVSMRRGDVNYQGC
jgi:hypothetical protein